MNEHQLQPDHALEAPPETTPSQDAEREHVPEAVALDQAAVEPAVEVPETIAHADEAEAMPATGATPPLNAAAAPPDAPSAGESPPVTEADVPPAPAPAHEFQAALPPANEPELPVLAAGEPQVALQQSPEAQTLAEAAGAPAAAQQRPPKPPPTPAQIEGRKRAQAAWERVSGAKASNETLQGTVKSAIKGGLLLDIDGYRAFLPASQVRVPKGTAIETLVNEKVPVKVLDVDEARKRLVVSHRRAVEQERRAARAELIASLQVGGERQATVVRIADFGAFVDLGGVDALIPLGELAFERVEKTTDVVAIGDSFPVKILRVEENGKKIAASRKAALHDPWRDHADVVRQGATLEGKVIAKDPRLEVELAPGITGTLSDRDANPD